jgi:hypothetical protein
LRAYESADKVQFEEVRLPIITLTNTQRRTFTTAGTEAHRGKSRSELANIRRANGLARCEDGY